MLPKNNVYYSQDSLARRICRIRPSKSITKSVVPLALLQNVTISFQRLDAGLWRFSHGSSPSSCSKSAEATISLWLLFNVPEWLNTLPELRKAPPKPSVVHVFGTLRETKRFLSLWTVFHCRSLSPSASGTSVPWEVKEFNRLGAGAEVLTVTDFELPSNCWVMSRICFTRSGILYSLLSTKACSSACCKAFTREPHELAMSCKSDIYLNDMSCTSKSKRSPVALLNAALTSASGPEGTSKAALSSSSVSCGTTASECLAGIKNFSQQSRGHSKVFMWARSFLFSVSGSLAANFSAYENTCVDKASLHSDSKSRVQRW